MLQQTTTRWSKSFPTVVSVPVLQFTFNYERRGKPCQKKFRRQCDLRFVTLSHPIRCNKLTPLSRHQKNHIRVSKCKQCNKGVPSPKDLERHNNCVHNCTVRYFCPHDSCTEALYGPLDDGGLDRKDYWLNHLRAEHHATREEIKDLQRKGIPMAVRKDGVWSLCSPRNVLSQDPASQGIDSGLQK
jgi:hypothetical protein